MSNIKTPWNRLRAGSMPDLPSLFKPKTGESGTPAAGHDLASNRHSSGAMAPRRGSLPGPSATFQPKPREHVQHQAMLANDVYDRYPAGQQGTGATPGWKDISHDPAKLATINLKPDDLAPDSKSGFRARVYEPAQEPGAPRMPMQVVFAGTKDMSDLVANARQGLGFGSSHHKRAADIGSKMAGTDAQIVGHSLGGGLAGVASLASGGLQATTFNAAGLHPKTIDKYGAGNHDGAHVTNYHRAGEFLGSMQRHSPMPSAVGHQVSVPALDGQGSAPDLKSRASRHSIESVAGDLANPDVPLRHNPGRTNLFESKNPFEPDPLSGS